MHVIFFQVLILKYLIKFILLLTLLPFGNASAVTLDFFCVTFNSTGNCDDGEQQFSVDAIDLGSGFGTEFLFRNDDLGNLISNSANLAINEIYFDSSLLASVQDSDVNIIPASGVTFTLDSLSPPNLPGHETVGFTSDFGTETAGPGQSTAIQEGEIFRIVFETLSYTDNFLVALLADNFNIGIHVHSFADGGSESFVTSMSPVPVPAAIWLFGTALIGFVGMSRKTKV